MFYIIQTFRWDPAEIWICETEQEVRDYLKEENSEWGEITIIEGKERYKKEFKDKGDDKK